jgi:Tfp pilus assembly major pilin PilA
MLRYVAVVIPTTVILAGTLGTTGAYAAAGGNAATQASNANLGVGQDKGNGNAKHVAATPVAATPADTSTSTTVAPATASADTGVASSHVTSGTAGTSGDPTQPQPLSTADDNTGGANGQCPSGPYCSTRDGSASGNGNGGGQAVGKPCAGCVGKADNKNPKGQMPNGSDHNAGYECDRNHGIGRTNPAHTGCKTTPPVTCPSGQVMQDGQCVTPPGTCPTGQVMQDGACVTPPVGCPEGTVLAAGMCQPTPDCVPTTANNNCQPSTPVVCPEDATMGADGTCVLGEQVSRNPNVQPDKVTRDPGTADVLPFTGAHVGGLLLAGVAGLLAGSALVVAGRRRKVTA